jgi:hypothetical protein
MSQENIGARETGAINQQRHHYNYFDQNTNTAILCRKVSTGLNAHACG